jgi:hypothetical protein
MTRTIIFDTKPSWHILKIGLGLSPAERGGGESAEAVQRFKSRPSLSANRETE